MRESVKVLEKVRAAIEEALAWDHPSKGAPSAGMIERIESAIWHVVADRAIPFQWVEIGDDGWAMVCPYCETVNALWWTDAPLWRMERHTGVEIGNEGRPYVHVSSSGWDAMGEVGMFDGFYCSSCGGISTLPDETEIEWD